MSKQEKGSSSMDGAATTEPTGDASAPAGKSGQSTSQPLTRDDLMARAKAAELHDELAACIVPLSGSVSVTKKVGSVPIDIAFSDGHQAPWQRKLASRIFRPALEAALAKYVAELKAMAGV